MGLFNKKTKIVAYALLNTKIKNIFLTITKTKDQAFEYVIMLLRLQHQSHYELWCELRELDKEDIKNWEQYFRDCIPDEEKEQFKIIKVNYEVDSVLAILRMFGNCIPIGCSFDTTEEENYFKAIIDESLAQQLAQKIEDTIVEAKAAELKKEDTPDGTK